MLDDLSLSDVRGAAYAEGYAAALADFSYCLGGPKPSLVEPPIKVDIRSQRVRAFPPARGFPAPIASWETAGVLCSELLELSMDELENYAEWRPREG